jgi:hypothetical protein
MSTTLQNNSGRDLLIIGGADAHWPSGTVRVVDLDAQPDWSAVSRAFLNGELHEVIEGDIFDHVEPVQSVELVETKTTKRKR